MNILEFTRSTHVRNKIVVGNYQVVQLVVNFGTSTMQYVPVVARVDNLRCAQCADTSVDPLTVPAPAIQNDGSRPANQQRSERHADSETTAAALADIHRPRGAQ
eukprot:SAG11_NODE_501_length_8895_cov_12.129832_7_plen_104_part_00